jgi:hypothetical protein
MGIDISPDGAQLRTQHKQTLVIAQADTDDESFQTPEPAIDKPLTSHIDLLSDDDDLRNRCQTIVLVQMMTCNFTMTYR